MNLRGFLPDLQNWTLGEIACAAGLLVFSAGAGYCIYRSVRRERAPPDRTQPPHEPVDVLGESLDTPSVLQAVDPIPQQLPTEPHDEPSSVVLPLDAGELNSACRDVQLHITDSSVSQSGPVDIRRDMVRMMRGPEGRLCWFESAETHRLTHEGFPYYADCEDSFTGIQVVKPKVQQLPNEHPQDTSPVFLPLDAGELNSAWRNIQFLSSDGFVSQSESLEIKRYFLGMIRGPETRLCWFKTTKKSYFNRLGFPYQSSIEDCYTGIQVVSGRVSEFVCCNRLETSIIAPLDGCMQNFVNVACTYLHVAADGQVNTSTWEKDHIRCPYSNSERQPDSEEMEVPFISNHLKDRGVTDIGLKLPALREAFATLLACMLNQNFLFVVGKQIVIRLAAYNKQDAVGVQLAYEALVRFLRTSNQGSIKTELSGARIKHNNFLDVFFELILFGYFKNGSTPETFIGGFLERLIAFIGMWDVDVWEPAAELYFTVLLDHLTELAEVLFSQPLELYGDPVAFRLLFKHHVQRMMDILEKL